MELADYSVLFAGGMTTSMFLMAIAHLLGVIIKMFFKIAR